MLIGGIAVIARGVPRKTDDVDATVWAPELDVAELLGRLAEHGIVPRISDAEAFAEQAQVLLLRHEPSGTPMEITLARLPFEEDALARAERIDIGTTAVPVALAEDLVVYKVVAARERDQADVERLLLLHGDAIDLGRVRRLVRAFADALDEPERVEAFEAIVRRSREP